MIKVYKYRIKDRSARKALRDHSTACNQVWNWCVAQHRDVLARYQAGAPKRPWLHPFALFHQCKGVGAELGIHQQTVQEVCEYWARTRSIRFRSSFGLKRARGWVPFQKQSRRTCGNTVTYLGRKFRIFGTKRRPVVKLPPRLLAHLRRWRRMDAEREQALRVLDPSARLTHVIHHGGVPLAGRVRTGFEGCVRDAGLEPETTPHWLRHTAATWLMEAGVDVWLASAYLGMTPETLIKVYGHVRPDYQAEAAGSFGRR